MNKRSGCNESKFLRETKNWTKKDWKKAMNISKVKMGGVVEGLWYPEGYFCGKVKNIGKEKGVDLGKGEVAPLNTAFSFRVVKK
jgi:hypothetical protein